ncbi:9533_t:CDS:1, partial [Funneliformis mosseae]
ENQVSSYKRKTFPEWKFDILDNSVDSVEKWLKKNCETPLPKLLTLDIVVASFRVNLKYLEQIINTEKPVTMSTIVFIIIDDPNSPNIITLKKKI